MGYAAVSLGHQGWVESDDVLTSDTDEHSTINTDWVERKTGKIITDLDGNSYLRFKLDMKSVGTDDVQAKVEIDGTSIWEPHTNAAVYVTKTADRQIQYKRESEIKVYQKSDTGTSWCWIKNFYICGKISPVRMD